MNLLVSLVALYLIQQCSPWNVGNYLHEIDENIIKLLEKPVNKNKRKLFETVNDYIETLQDLIEKISLKRRTALAAAEVLLLNEHPGFVNEEVDDNTFKEKFGWDDIDLDDYHRLVNETYEMWDEFKVAHKELKVYFSAEDKKKREYSDEY